MTLLNAIKNKDTRKIFGERELKIIEKQLKGVKLKPSEIVRLSRDIRKKFSVIKELAKYQEEFDLKKNTETKKIIEEAKRNILSSEWSDKIKKIILFWSVVEKENSLLSDIDIAVELENITEKESLLFRLRALRGLAYKIDLQVYNFLPDKIKREINERGKTIWEKK